MKEKLNIQTLQSRGKAQKTLSSLFLLLAMTIYVLAPMQVAAQNTSSEFSTQGTEFYLTIGQCSWVVDPDGYTDVNLTKYYYNFSPNYMGLRVAAAEETEVFLEFTNNPSLNRSFIVQGGGIGPEPYQFSSEEKKALHLERPYQSKGSTVSGPYPNTVNKSLRITSDKPISVYVTSNSGGMSDATNVLPVSSLGTAYYHISYPPISLGGTTYEYARYDGYAIIATEDGTTDIYDKNGNAIKLGLSKGEVYYNYSAPEQIDNTGGYTGKIFAKSDKRFAYFVINTGARVPYSTSNGSTDNLFQQMLPVNSWGRQFAVPVTSRGKERIRIMASLPNTKFKVTTGSGTGYSKIYGGTQSGDSINITTAGGFVEYEITTGCYIGANKPVAVCSYLVGSDNITIEKNGDANAVKGDPAMTWIPPVEQKIKSTIVAPFDMYVSQGSGLKHHFLIVVNTDAKNSTTLAIGQGTAGALSGGSWHDIGSTGQSYYNYPIADGDKYKTFTISNEEGLTVLGYGYGSSQGYYYLAGAATRNLNPHFTVDGIHQDDVRGTVFCKNTFEIQAYIYSKSTSSPLVKWSIANSTTGNVYQELSSYRNNEGPFTLSNLPLGSNKIKLEVNNYDNIMDVRETEIFVNTVTITEPTSRTITVGETITLSGNGYPTTATGVWASLNSSIASVNASTGVVTGVTPGTATITYTHNGCNASIEITVIEEACPFTSIVYVKDYTNSKTSGSPGDRSGTSWYNAHESLADVLRAACKYPGCIKEIWVAEGTYYPKYNASTGLVDATRDRAFVVPDGVKVIGGFPGNATDALHGKAVIPDVNNAIEKRNWGIYPTIMSGNLGSLGSNTDNAYHVVILSGATETTEINGFTIRDGNADGSTTTITVNGNIIDRRLGGGVNSNTSYAKILYCTIKNNTAAYGGGFYQSGAVTGYVAAGASFTKVTYFSNVLICDNTATSMGGGLYNDNSNGTRFEYVTISGNTANVVAGAFYINTGGTYSFYNSISWGNTKGTTFGSGTISGEVNRIEGLISAVSTQYNPYLTSDYGLSSGSESIDKASYGAGVVNRFFDVAGNPREILCRKDLGAYEYQSPIVPTNKRVYVKDYAYYGQSAPADADGSSWVKAYPNLADVVRLAEVSYEDCITEIWVTGGTYYPKYALDGKNVTGLSDVKNATFNLPAGVSVYGGFAGSETTVSARQNINPLYETSTNVSILSGDIDGTTDDYSITTNFVFNSSQYLIYKNTGGNANHVVTSKESKASPATLLDGFTIQGGHAQNESDGGELSSGGGLYIIGTSAPTLSNLTVRWNTAHYLGGGIADCSEGNKTITNLRVYENMGLEGGGIGKMRNGSLSIYNFDISNNKGDSELMTNVGGGIAHGMGSLYLVNGKITGNHSDIGAGIRVNAFTELGQPVIFNLTNVTVADNMATRIVSGNGGGIAMRTTLVTGTINNSIIWNNKAGVAGTNNLYFEFTPTLSTSYSIVEGSGGSTSWQSGFGTNGGSNLDVDPKFVGSGTYPYRLSTSSPAIDVANNVLYSNTGRNYNTDKDISGANRLLGTIIDMGAYEVTKVELPNLWIGGGGLGKNGNLSSSKKNDWSESINWTANRLPREDETVYYHEDALDLYVNNDYKVIAIDATTSNYERGLRVLKNTSLELTGTNPVSLGTGKLYIEGGDPFNGEYNGSFITQANKTITATVQMKSRAKNQKVSNNLYDPDVLAWQYFGIPVKADPSVTPDAFFIGAIVRRYSEAAVGGKHWVSMNKTDQMYPYLGYELAWLTENMGSNTNGIFEFSGSLVNGNYTMALGKTSNALFSGYHVVSNPYSAGLSIQTGLTFGSNMEKTVYLFHTGSSLQWDEWAAGTVGDGTGEGQYIAVPQHHAGQGPYLPETVSSLQGFVVKTGDSDNLTFNYSGVKKNTGVLRSDEEKEVKVYTMATLSSTEGKKLKDRLWMFTDANTTRGFDNGYDGKKMLGSSHLTQLYAVEEDGDYQVNTVPDINNTYFAFKAEEGTLNYTLTFNHQNVWQSYDKIYLIDLETDGKTLIDITGDGATYSFTAYNTDKAVKRFKIVTESSITGVDDADACGFDIRYLNEEIVISNCEEKADVSIYTVTGVMVYKTSLQPYQTEFISEGFAPGVYMVHAQLPNEKVVRKVVVK